MNYVYYKNSAGFPLETIFNSINLRLKYLRTKEHKERCNIEEKEDCNNTKKKFFVLLYAKHILESVASVIDKTKFTVGYKIINKLNKFFFQSS